MRIDYVNGIDEYDAVWWFFDGKYVGHDDQIEAQDFCSPGVTRDIEFAHRIPKPTDDYEEFYNEMYEAESLADVEHLLEPA